MPHIALGDIGKYARWMFDNQDEITGKTLSVSSEHLSGKKIAETFTKVTGQKAEYRPITIEQFFAHVPPTLPLSPAEPDGITFVKSFTAWFNIYRNDKHKTDYAILDKILPERLDFEKWLRETGFNGTNVKSILKIKEDGTNPAFTLILNKKQ